MGPDGTSHTPRRRSGPISKTQDYMAQTDQFGDGLFRPRARGEYVEEQFVLSGFKY